MFSRRKILAATVAAISTYSLSGPGYAQDKPFDGVQLSVLMEGHPTTDAIQKMLPEFKTLTGIDVALEVVPEQDITAKMLLGAVLQVRTLRRHPEQHHLHSGLREERLHRAA